MVLFADGCAVLEKPQARPSALALSEQAAIRPLHALRRLAQEEAARPLGYRLCGGAK